MHRIQHIVVVMMENHSFDNIIGSIPRRARHGPPVDGLPVRHGRQLAFNRDADGNKVYSERADTVCQDHAVPSQAWNASHISYDHGLNDGFVRASGPRAMRFYGRRRRCPSRTRWQSTFPIGERYFCSCLAQTYPQFRYLLTGTSSGMIRTDSSTFSVPAANGTIYDRFDQFGIDWKNYYDSLPASLVIPGVATATRGPRFVKGVQNFLDDAAAGRLPQFSFVNPDYDAVSQENPQDVQFGDRFLAQVTQAVMGSPQWDRTVLFITYDEHGGYYDHVPPPAAIKPDAIPPLLQPGDVAGGFHRYGFRVPLDRRLAVGPQALRLARRPGPHLDHSLRRDQVEPGGDDLPRRERGRHDRLFRTSRRRISPIRPSWQRPPDPQPGLDVCAKHGQYPPLPPTGAIAKRSGTRLPRRPRAGHGLPRT